MIWKIVGSCGFSSANAQRSKLGEMKQAIIGFGEVIKQNENAVGLFYFSGHGMQYQEKNFLFPIGAMKLQ
jgi:uncharacterized caspase-like protein